MISLLSSKHQEYMNWLIKIELSNKKFLVLVLYLIQKVDTIAMKSVLTTSNSIILIQNFAKSYFLQIQTFQKELISKKNHLWLHR